MKPKLIQRTVARVTTPPVKKGMNNLHRIRELVEFSDSDLTDPFLMLMEDWFPRGVFSLHPHRGMETVTYSISGQLDHRDNKGNQGSILPGEAQWMTAGRGIVHNEVPAEGQVVHSLQLWVNLPKAEKMAEPRYQELHAGNVKSVTGDGYAVRVFSGSFGGTDSATKNHAQVTFLEVNLEPGAQVAPDFPPDYNAFLVVLKGKGFAGAAHTPISAGNVVYLTQAQDAPSEVLLRADDEPMKVLVYAGKPLREPVVAGGPFVMNSAEEIEQAFADYRAGLM